MLQRCNAAALQLCNAVSLYAITQQHAFATRDRPSATVLLQLCMQKRKLPAIVGSAVSCMLRFACCMLRVAMYVVPLLCVPHEWIQGKIEYDTLAAEDVFVCADNGFDPSVRLLILPVSVRRVHLFIVATCRAVSQHVVLTGCTMLYTLLSLRRGGPRSAHTSARFVREPSAVLGLPPPVCSFGHSLPSTAVQSTYSAELFEPEHVATW